MLPVLVVVSLCESFYAFRVFLAPVDSWDLENTLRQEEKLVTERTPKTNGDQNKGYNKNSLSNSTRAVRDAEVSAAAGRGRFLEHNVPLSGFRWLRPAARVRFHVDGGVEDLRLFRIWGRGCVGLLAVQVF